jgi:polysaccharide pyruvyl transferase CsaB
MTGGRARLLLSGYYGFDNFGDEAILRVFVEQWRRRRPQDDVTVLSASPRQTEDAFGVRAAPRMLRSAVVEALAQADVVVSGGGGLLQSSTSLRSLAYYVGVLYQAQRMGKRTAIFAQGIGPLSPLGRFIARGACRRLGLAIVRDAASARTLRALAPALDVRTGADPVFAADLGTSGAAAERLAAEGIPPRGDVVAIVVRRSRLLDRMRVALAALADRFMTHYHAQVVFVPFQRPGDVAASITVIQACRSAPVLLGGGYDLPTMAALFARCSAVVGMRLHALVLAAATGVPFLALAYDPKITALVEALAYPLAPPDAGSLAAAADRLWADRAGLADAARAGAARQRALAEQSFDWLAAWVEGSVS